MSNSDNEQYINLPSCVIPNVYGHGFYLTITDVSVKYHSQPKPKEPNVRKIMKKFESDSKKILHTAMWTGVLSTNPSESDATWEAYQRWVNSKI